MRLSYLELSNVPFTYFTQLIRSQHNPRSARAALYGLGNKDLPTTATSGRNALVYHSPDNHIFVYIWPPTGIAEGSTGSLIFHAAPTIDLLLLIQLLEFPDACREPTESLPQWAERQAAALLSRGFPCRLPSGNILEDAALDLPATSATGISAHSLRNLMADSLPV